MTGFNLCWFTVPQKAWAPMQWFPLSTPKLLFLPPYCTSTAQSSPVLYKAVTHTSLRSALNQGCRTILRQHAVARHSFKVVAYPGWRSQWPSISLHPRPQRHLNTTINTWICKAIHSNRHHKSLTMCRWVCASRMAWCYSPILGPVWCIQFVLWTKGS